MTNRKKILENSITVLKLDIKKLIKMVEDQYNQVIEAIVQNDIKKALAIIENDQEINDLAEDIDLETLIVIARYQPVASDLRRVMTINKLAYELERIADYAKNIARYVITGHEKKVIESPNIITNFQQMFQIIFEMLETNLAAFENEDKELARKALLMDQKIDEAYKKNFEGLLQRFKEESREDVQHMISMALILNKQIERAGDHLTNISEHILYLIKGKRYYADEFIDDQWDILL
ncbi:MAG TPA: phosphate signaling complex protein PhoU [Haloplasmataceae bacterium]